jgi:hypothetical protein
MLTLKRCAKVNGDGLLSQDDLLEDRSANPLLWPSRIRLGGYSLRMAVLEQPQFPLRVVKCQPTIKEAVIRERRLSGHGQWLFRPNFGPPNIFCG